MELGFMMLLRAAWLAGTLPILVASAPFVPYLPFHRIVMGFEKQGKIMQSSLNKFTVPLSFFLHFYVLAVMWTTILVLATWPCAYNPMVPMPFQSMQYSTIVSHLTGGSHSFSIQKSHPDPVEHIYRVWRAVFLLLMELQVLRRLHETLYVFNYTPSARMHIFGYLAGIFFYTAAPHHFAAFVLQRSSVTWPFEYRSLLLKAELEYQILSLIDGDM